MLRPYNSQPSSSDSRRWVTLESRPSRKWRSSAYGAGSSTCMGLGWRHRRGSSGGETRSSRCARSISSPHRSEEHTSELQSRGHLVCRLLPEKKNVNLVCPLHYSLQTAANGTSVDFSTLLADRV